MFSIVEGEVAILTSKGVFRQTTVYKRRGGIYAKWGSGFIRLRSDGGTSIPNVRVETLTWEGPLGTDVHGRLVDPNTYVGAKQINENHWQKLIGSGE